MLQTLFRTLALGSLAGLAAGFILITWLNEWIPSGWLFILKLAMAMAWPLALSALVRIYQAIRAQFPLEPGIREQLSTVPATAWSWSARTAGNAWNSLRRFIDQLPVHRSNRL